MDDDDQEEVFFGRLVAAMGAPPLEAEEVATVLRLAKVVADSSQRRFAPLSCYAAGMVVGTAPENRSARLRALLEQVASVTATAGDG